MEDMMERKFDDRGEETARARVIVMPSWLVREEIPQPPVQTDPLLFTDEEAARMNRQLSEPDEPGQGVVLQARVTYGEQRSVDDLNDALLEERNREVKQIEGEMEAAGVAMQFLQREVARQADDLESAARSLEDTSYRTEETVDVLEAVEKGESRWRRIKLWAWGTAAFVGAGLVTITALSLRSREDDSRRPT